MGTISDINSNYETSKECKSKGQKGGSTKSVASMDPNEMIGPSGFGDANYIAKQPMNYTIIFENKATATAAAQEVVITNQIDATKFDISSVRFTGFGYAEAMFTPVQDGTSFAQDIILNETNTLRVTGHVDAVQNIITWRFLTLDNSTLDLTEDAEAGKPAAELSYNAGGSGVRHIEAANGMRLYPNPAHDYVDVEFTDFSGDNQLNIFSADGKKLLEAEVSGCETRIPLNGFAKGIYVVRCGAFTEKLIVR